MFKKIPFWRIFKRRAAKKSAERLFKDFARYMEEVEIPHLFRQAKMWDQIMARFAAIHIKARMHRYVFGYDDEPEQTGKFATMKVPVLGGKYGEK